MLTTKWQSAQAEKTGTSQLSTFDRWREQVKTGEDIAIRKVFAEMKPYTEKDNELSNQQILMEMQWGGFVSTLFETEPQKIAIKTQIANGILFLIDEIEKLNPAPLP